MPNNSPCWRGAFGASSLVASVAQLVEQLTLNQLVLGSSPSRGTNFAEESAVFHPFRLAPMLAVVSNVVSRGLKWWRCSGEPYCYRASVSAPAKRYGKGLVGAAGEGCTVPPCQLPDGSLKRATAPTPCSGVASGAFLVASAGVSSWPWFAPPVALVRLSASGERLLTGKRNSFLSVGLKRRRAEALLTRRRESIPPREKPR
jgi:hypothetical protein